MNFGCADFELRMGLPSFSSAMSGIQPCLFSEIRGDIFVTHARDVAH